MKGPDQDELGAPHYRETGRCKRSVITPTLVKVDGPTTTQLLTTTQPTVTTMLIYSVPYTQRLTTLCTLNTSKLHHSNRNHQHFVSPYVVSMLFQSFSNSSALIVGLGLSRIAGAESRPPFVRLLRMDRGESGFSEDGTCSSITSNLRCSNTKDTHRHAITIALRQEHEIPFTMHKDL